MQLPIIDIMLTKNDFQGRGTAGTGSVCTWRFSFGFLLSVSPIQTLPEAW